MKPQKNRKIITFLKALPLIVCIIFIVLFLASGNDITVQTVLSYTPESPFAAAMVILLLYALKSVSFVFPIAVLQIATGHLFQTPVALFINFLGKTITLSIPYWVGRFSGSDMTGSLQRKYPKIKKITEPTSPAFWLSASLMALMAVISVFFYLRNSRKKAKEEHSP